MKNEIARIIRESISLKNEILSNNLQLESIETAANTIIDCYKNGKKVLFCGNGGSAADAQHLAAELSGRFYFNRPPLQAEALHVNTSFLTAVANDFGFDFTFARMVEAWGKSGDVLVALSTSGNSPNILKAIDAAHTLGMTIIGFTGNGGGKMADICNVLINITSTNTPRIQEAHILIGHIICEQVEKTLFEKQE